MDKRSARSHSPSRKRSARDVSPTAESMQQYANNKFYTYLEKELAKQISNKKGEEYLKIIIKNRKKYQKK